MCSRKVRSVLAVLASAILLTACGGGGGDDLPESTAQVDPVDKYLGTWLFPCFSWRDGGLPGDPDNRSMRSESIVVKIDAHQFAETATQYEYTDATCSTTPVVMPHGAWTLEWIDMKTIDFGEVDKLIGTRGLDVRKGIAQVVDDKLYSAREGLLIPVDAEGFPLVIDNSRYGIRIATP